MQDGSGSGVYAQRYNSTGLPVGSEFRVNTYTTNDQSNPSVAMDNDGDFVVTWESGYSFRGQDGSKQGIYAQRYKSDGSTNGSEFRVNTYTTAPQQNPAIAMDNDGDFVVTWGSYQENCVNNGFGGYNCDKGIYAQRYDSTGSSIGSEFRVNTYIANNQQYSSVAMDNDGDFVVTWESGSNLSNFPPDQEQDGFGFGIYAQRYNSTGSSVGSEFKVNSFTSNEQRVPAVAMDNDGDFVVIWTSSAQDGSGVGTYAQMYDSTGSVAGSEFRVNTYTTGGQGAQSVSMDNNGNFIITWSRYVPNESFGIFAKRYNSQGEPF